VLTGVKSGLMAVMSGLMAMVSGLVGAEWESVKPIMRHRTQGES
jgi:hypothetical protein